MHPVECHWNYYVMHLMNIFYPLLSLHGYYRCKAVMADAADALPLTHVVDMLRHRQRDGDQNHTDQYQQ